MLYSVEARVAVYADFALPTRYTFPPDYFLFWRETAFDNTLVAQMFVAPVPA